MAAARVRRLLKGFLATSGRTPEKPCLHDEYNYFAVRYRTSSVDCHRSLPSEIAMHG